MGVRTRRWNDPPGEGDGFRLLICRYRPRGVRKADETWDAWWPNLGPSRQLHADFYGKGGTKPLTWAQYKKQYLTEVRAPAAREGIDQLARRVIVDLLPVSGRRPQAT